MRAGLLLFSAYLYQDMQWPLPFKYSGLGLSDLGLVGVTYVGIAGQGLIVPAFGPEHYFGLTNHCKNKLTASEASGLFPLGLPHPPARIFQLDYAMVTVRKPQPCCCGHLCSGAATPRCV